MSVTGAYQQGNIEGNKHFSTTCCRQPPAHPPSGDVFCFSPATTANNVCRPTACIDGSTECVRRLLAAGASHFPPDAWGRDPAAVARQLDRAGPLRLLEAAAAVAAGGRKSNGGSVRNGSSALPAASTRGGDGGDVSGGDPGTVIADFDGGVEGGGQLERGFGLGEEGGSAAPAIVVGKRWVVMNESGRMLERRSGKV